MSVLGFLGLKIENVLKKNQQLNFNSFAKLHLDVFALRSGSAVIENLLWFRDTSFLARVGHQVKAREKTYSSSENDSSSALFVTYLLLKQQQQQFI